MCLLRLNRGDGLFRTTGQGNSGEYGRSALLASGLQAATIGIPSMIFSAGKTAGRLGRARLDDPICGIVRQIESVKRAEFRSGGYFWGVSCKSF